MFVFVGCCCCFYFWFWLVINSNDEMRMIWKLLPFVVWGRERKKKVGKATNWEIKWRKKFSISSISSLRFHSNNKLYLSQRYSDVCRCSVHYFFTQHVDTSTWSFLFLFIIDCFSNFLWNVHEMEICLVAYHERFSCRQLSILDHFIDMVRMWRWQMKFQILCREHQKHFRRRKFMKKYLCDGNIN